MWKRQYNTSVKTQHPQPDRFGPLVVVGNWEPLMFRRRVNEGGTGLGMSIVKSVIEAHNGTLFLSSKPNGGTTFRVTLPLID